MVDREITYNEISYCEITYCDEISNLTPSLQHGSSENCLKVLQKYCIVYCDYISFQK